MTTPKKSAKKAGSPKKAGKGKFRKAVKERAGNGHGPRPPRKK